MTYNRSYRNTSNLTKEDFDRQARKHRTILIFSGAISLVLVIVFFLLGFLIGRITKKVPSVPEAVSEKTESLNNEPAPLQENNNDLDAVSRLQQFINEGNYEYAVAVYEEFGLQNANISDDLLQKLEQLRLTYRDEKITQAIEAYQTDGYDSALFIVEDALAFIKNDAKLQQYRDLFANNKEVPLDDNFLMCDYGYQPNYYTNITDLYENSYSYAFVFYIDSDTFKESYATFALNGEYTDFQFTYFPEKRRSTDDTYADKRTLKIYGDDTLLFDTGGVSKMDKPQTVTIDVTGIEFLKITAGTGAFWVGDGATEAMALAEGKVWKQLLEEDFNLIDALYDAP